MSLLIHTFARRAAALAPTSLVHRGSSQVVAQLPLNRCFSAPTEETPEKIVNLVDELCTLNVIEMNQLVNLFKDKVGLSGVDMMPQMMMGGGMPGGGAVGGAAAPVEEEAPKVEKDIFDVKLDSFDAASKIKVIKEVRAITGLGLKEAKELVEGAPKVMKKDLSKKDAEEIVAKLKAVGGVVLLE